jgi:hypothetical protein
MVVNNGTTEILAEVYRHENGGMKGVQIRLANLLGSRIKSGVVPMDNTIDFPEVQSHLPNPSKPLSLSVRAPETKKAYMISLDYDALVELPFRIEKGVVEVEVPKLYRSALIYLSSGDDREILKIGGGKAVREVPKAKELVYMESTRLAKRASGPAITIFPETSAVKGGTARSFYRNEMSTFIYGAESDVNEMEVQFDSDLKLKNPLLEIGGMNDNAKVHATIEVTLNQERLFLGKTRFPSDEWGILSFPMKEIALKEKGNQLKIRIVGKGTHAGPPWFGVTYLRFQNDSK